MLVLTTLTTLVSTTRAMPREITIVDNDSKKQQSQGPVYELQGTLDLVNILKSCQSDRGLDISYYISVDRDASRVPSRTVAGCRQVLSPMGTGSPTCDVTATSLRGR